MGWMIYGANGYTGRLVAVEALRRGHRPTLAGRSAEELAELGSNLGLPWRTFPLDDERALRRGIEDQELVFHAAGPYVHTAAPMLAACLDVGAHYVDITGEIPVYQEQFARDEEARRRGIAILPGAGFDVVPSDCLAKYVAERLPGATRLELAIAGARTTSPGTARSIVESLQRGGLVRKGGELVPWRLGEGARSVRFVDGSVRTVLPIPWGDLETAWRSTGIPDIVTLMEQPPGADGLIRLLAPVAVPALRSEGLRRMVVRILGAAAEGPSVEERRTARTHFRARATAPDGRQAEAWLEAPEAYEFTARSAVRIVERILAERPVGTLTPSLAFGADFVLQIPGVERFDALPTSDEGRRAG